MTVCSNMTFRKKNLDCKHAATVLYYAYQAWEKGLASRSALLMHGGGGLQGDRERRREDGRWRRWNMLHY